MTIKAPWGDSIPLELTAVKGFDGVVWSHFSGRELWFTVKKDTGEADPGVLQKTITGGGITTNGGTAAWEITDEESRTLFLPGETYLYDVQVRDEAGRIATVDKGKITLSDDITKSS